MSAGFEADKLRAWDARGGALTRGVGSELVVFGVDNQRRHADRLQGVGVNVGVGDCQVEVVTRATYREQAVDELGDDPSVLTRHDE